MTIKSASTPFPLSFPSRVGSSIIVFHPPLYLCILQLVLVLVLILIQLSRVIIQSNPNPLNLSPSSDISLDSTLNVPHPTRHVFKRLFEFIFSQIGCACQTRLVAVFGFVRECVFETIFDCDEAY